MSIRRNAITGGWPIGDARPGKFEEHVERRNQALDVRQHGSGIVRIAADQMRDLRVFRRGRGVGREPERGDDFMFDPLANLRRGFADLVRGQGNSDHGVLL